MKALPLKKGPRAEAAGTTPIPMAPVVEVPVLLESRLLVALESAACEQGMTTGAFLRCLVRDYVDFSESDLPVS